MLQPFVGEIRMVGFRFAPVGWYLCDGSLKSIAEDETLFNLIGTTYGGDGQTTFALPDLRGRVPVHMGQGAGLSNRLIGQMGGVETVTLTLTQIPSHTHTAMGDSGGATANSPSGNVWATATNIKQFALPPTTPSAMNAGAVANAGLSQAHDNMLPFQVVNFIISRFGVFPSQT